jgi:hypothetical protein
MATFPLSDLYNAVATNIKAYFVNGPAADDAAATGNPVLIAGRFTTAPATRHSGDAVALELTATGQVKTVAEPSTTLYCNTKTDVGVSAAAIASTQACRELVVQADPDNTVDIFIGNATTQTIQLKPGVAISIPCSDVALVYAKSASSTGTVNWLARN